jgi:hypothetical protein
LKILFSRASGNEKVARCETSGILRARIIDATGPEAALKLATGYLLVAPSAHRIRFSNRFKSKTKLVINNKDFFETS